MPISVSSRSSLLNCYMVGHQIIKMAKIIHKSLQNFATRLLVVISPTELSISLNDGSEWLFLFSGPVFVQLLCSRIVEIAGLKSIQVTLLKNKHLFCSVA